MELHIRDVKHFFVSVPLNPKEHIAFEYTPKTRRVLKQVLVAKRPFPKKPAQAVWSVVVLKDGKVAKTEHVKALAAEGKEQLNDELWETVFDKPISKELAEAIKAYVDLILKNQKNLDKHQKRVMEFETLMHKALAEQIVSILQSIKKKA